MSRILVVEDDRDLAENVHLLMRRLGAVEVCTDAGAAAEGARSPASWRAPRRCTGPSSTRSTS